MPTQAKPHKNHSRLAFEALSIEGGLLSPDWLARVAQLQAGGQTEADYQVLKGLNLRDEIGRYWRISQAHWNDFEAGRAVGSDRYRLTERFVADVLRNGFGFASLAKVEPVTIADRTFPIGHAALNGRVPVVIAATGNGLDTAVIAFGDGGRRRTAFGLAQEYLNAADHALWGIVSDGDTLRILRDNASLTRPAWIEADLARIFTEGRYADFAALWLLVHETRFGQADQPVTECPLETWRLAGQEQGTRARNKLRKGVEEALISFGQGFPTHPENQALRTAIHEGRLTPAGYYRQLLRLVYRLIFLLTAEERDLLHPSDADEAAKRLYREGYSLRRLRDRSFKRNAYDRFADLWEAVKIVFRGTARGETRLGLPPLGGIFAEDQCPDLDTAKLENRALLGGVFRLAWLPEESGIARVNWRDMGSDEFGSVYESLLEFVPQFGRGGREFSLIPGDERAATGSHYTPDILVRPLLTHSLDYLIAGKLAEPDPVAALLSLRVADIACGSGHILVAAARRIATSLALARRGGHQPTPAEFRTALRDTIHECIYGVDLNPLAVELCKVALWLEAQTPGEPLSFLDHHIKCGNAIVGFLRREDLERGIPDEAFAAQPGDDKELMTTLRKRNKKERADYAKRAGQLNFSVELSDRFAAILARWREISTMPERSALEVEAKKRRYEDFTRSHDAWLLQQIACIPIAQFYLPRTPDNRDCFITDMEYRDFLVGYRQPMGKATAAAWVMAQHKRFFHWFLEFPDIIERGGFDCILGNPPYLGGQDLSGTYGHSFCHYVKWEFAPTGLSDLVVFFVRRIFSLLCPSGFTAFITTNSIKDGDIRKDGLEQVVATGGSINFAVRGIKWPGQAKLVVSLVALHHGEWKGKHILDGSEVPTINAFFEDAEVEGEPKTLTENEDRIFKGSFFLGDGFLLSHQEAEKLIQIDSRNKEVIFPIINGQELNNNPDQKPGRSIINFHNWPIEKVVDYQEPHRIVEQKVKPEREKVTRAVRRERWWQYAERAAGLYRGIDNLSLCFITTRHTKYFNFSASPTNRVFSDALYVFATDRWDLYAVVQSNLHEVWARKFSGALKQDLRLSPSKCFDTFAFPGGLWDTPNPTLATIGERYHEHRRELMLRLWLGLTDIYNLFHNPELTPAKVAKVSGKPAEADTGQAGILRLRELHRELDEAVLAAYGWRLRLGHSFHEIETLPENDRVRYTISPEARKEILSRLLVLNHERHAEQVEAKTKKPTSKRKLAKAATLPLVEDTQD